MLSNLKSRKRLFPLFDFTTGFGAFPARLRTNDRRMSASVPAFAKNDKFAVFRSADPPAYHVPVRHILAVSLSMRFHADAFCAFLAMMAIVMQNTAVCRVAEASLRTIRALRRPQRALQRPLRPSLSPSSGGRLSLQRIPFSTICSACRFHAFCRAERWLARPFMRFPRPSSPVDGRQLLSARSFCLRAVPWLLHSVRQSGAPQALLAHVHDARGGRPCFGGALL